MLSFGVGVEIWPLLMRDINGQCLTTASRSVPSIVLGVSLLSQAHGMGTVCEPKDTVTC